MPLPITHKYSAFFFEWTQDYVGHSFPESESEEKEKWQMRKKYGNAVWKIRYIIRAHVCTQRFAEWHWCWTKNLIVFIGHLYALRIFSLLSCRFLVCSFLFSWQLYRTWYNIIVRSPQIFFLPTKHGFSAIQKLGIEQKTVDNTGECSILYFCDMLTFMELDTKRRPCFLLSLVLASLCPHC